MLSLVRQTDVCREQHASDELHHRIEKIWQARLGLSSIDHAADFFELGGDSLQALEMLYEINDLLGIEVPLTTLFEDKFTIAGLMGIVGATSVAGLD
jgi:acyl carrier protein